MGETGPDGNVKLNIRKYPNRRYYDTTRSRHVTLEEIHALIRQGYEVEVHDSRSGDDITPKVLAQIIIELDTPKLDVFPVALLHRLLRSNQQIAADFVQKYFNQPLASFLDSQRGFEQYVRQAMGLRSPSPTLADWTKVMLGPFGAGLAGGAAGGGPIAPAPAPDAPNAPAPAPPEGAAGPCGDNGAPAPAPPAGEDWRGVVDQLRREIGELRQHMAAPAPAAPAPAPARPRGSAKPATEANGAGQGEHADASPRRRGRPRKR